MLTLRFSTEAGRVELTADPGFTATLQRLRSRFATSQSLNLHVFDVDIDDLLINLHELAMWPAEDQAHVIWEPQLLALVQANYSDAQLVAQQLSNPGMTPPQLSPLGGGWQAPLTQFQERDLRKLLQLSHGANFSVPGAGKTRVGLALFQARRDQGTAARMLVVAPKSAFESWQGEALTCYPYTPPKVAVMSSSAVPAADIVLINYERLPDARPALLQWLRDQACLVILDEAHRMKLGSAGAWGAACLALGPYAAGRLILSGTPAPNGAADLENLMSFVWPGQGRAAVTRAVNGNDLRTASTQLRPLFTRTTKAELQLPPVTTTIRRVDLPQLHRDLYDALLGHASAHWQGGEQDAQALGRVLLYLLMAATTPALLAVGASRHEPLAYRIPPLQPPPGTDLSTLMRDLPLYELSPKYRETLAIVAANAAVGRKTLIWSTFVRSLTSLAQMLSAYSPAVVHGGTEDRTEQLQRFRQDPSCMVLLSNPATLGEGVSLHRECHDAIYVDRDFAAGRFLQSLDRIHRLGLLPDTQTRITVLVANDTIDELVEQRLAAKLDFMGGVLNDPAVLQLGALDEEPNETVGMTDNDVQALIGYLGRAPR